MRALRKISVLVAWVAVVATATATPPQYQIYDIGVVQGDSLTPSEGRK